MVHFKELKIDQERNRLIISAFVDNSTYYKDVYISKIFIGTDYYVSWPSEELGFHKIEVENTKEVELCLSINDLTELKLSSLNEKLLFVYIKTSGTPSPDTPCGCDSEYIMGVVYDIKSIYDTLIQYIKELTNNCSVPSNLINAFLKYKMLQVAIDTGHYQEAINIWEQFYGDNKQIITTSKPCGCNG